MVIGIDDAIIGAGVTALGALGSAGISAGASQSANALSFEQNKELMNLQHRNQLESNWLQGMWNVGNSKDYTKWLQENSYLNTRRGLERAGYNPILAYSSNPMNGAQSIGAGSASGGSVQPPDYSNAMNQLSKAFDVIGLMQGAKNVQNTEANTNATNAGASLIEAQEKTEQYKQKNMEADTAVKLIDEALRKKEFNWYDRRQLAEIKSMYINSEANHLLAEAKQKEAHTGRLMYDLQKGITDYDNIRRRAETDFINNHPKLFNYNEAKKYLYSNGYDTSSFNYIPQFLKSLK